MSCPILDLGWAVDLQYVFAVMGHALTDLGTAGKSRRCFPANPHPAESEGAAPPGSRTPGWVSPCGSGAGEPGGGTGSRR